MVEKKESQDTGIEQTEEVLEWLAKTSLDVGRGFKGVCIRVH